MANTFSDRILTPKTVARLTRQPVLNALFSGVAGANRVAFTMRTLAVTGVSWLAGDRPPPARLLRQTFEKLGTTYIKLGQFIASAPSLFPEEYVTEFQHCLDNAPTLPFSYIKQVVEKELGKPIEDVYAFVDTKPLASASIAQVHAARLLNGDEVVIKVQKPGVQKTLLTDFNFMYIAARVFELIAPGFSRNSIAGIVQELQAQMLEECDFIKEAGNLVEFNEFLKCTMNTQAVAPRPYMEATTLRVLTMERFFGVPLTDLESIKKVTDKPAEVLMAALDTWFASLNQCSFFHADVHGGNLMVLDDGRVGFIDFGIVGRISEGTWAGVALMFGAISGRDYAALAQAMVMIGMTKETVDTDQLGKDIEILFSKMDEVDYAFLSEMGGQDERMNKMVMDLVSLAEGHGIRFPREFALLIKQFLYFDRYVALLAPEVSLFEAGKSNVMPDFERLGGPAPFTKH